MKKLIKRGRRRPQTHPRSPPRGNRGYPLRHGASPPREGNRNRGESPLRLTGRIDTIFGGCAGGGDSWNSRKNYARREVYASSSTPIWVEAISFSDAEL
ncbi:hypothetical protein LIER_36718 [Lithospermum erythrorhizon]